MIPDVAVSGRIPGRGSRLLAALGLVGSFWLAGGAAIAQGPAPAATANDLAVIAAAAKGDLDGVAKAMRAGGGVKARDAQGRTALLAATYGNHVPVALLLMAAGSDVNAKDNQDNSAFLLAGAEGYLDILKLTLRSGADVKSTNRYGGTALIPAAHHGHVEAVKELLKTAVPVDHVNKLGWTALLEAIILGDGGARHTEIVRLLVAAKADVNLADKDGATPLAHAKRRGYAEMARILETAAAK